MTVAEDTEDVPDLPSSLSSAGPTSASRPWSTIPGRRRRSCRTCRVTRDRVAYDAGVGSRFTVVDTGGWEPDAKGFQGRVAAQAGAGHAHRRRACWSSTPVGATVTDEAAARVLRRAQAGVLVANKVYDERTELEAAPLCRWGWGPRG
jgi:GTP-binding protein